MGGQKVLSSFENDDIQELVSGIEFLEQTMNAIGQQADEERWARSLAEDKIQRQDELLEGYRQQAKKMVKEDRVLSILTNPLTDKGARRTMRQLCQDIEQWVKRNFSPCLPANTHNCYENLHPPTDCHTWESIHIEVADRIFEKIFAPFMVGFEKSIPNHCLLNLDMKIQISECPAQAWQFWRLAMSIAVASDSSSTLEDISKSIGNAVEELYSQFSTTDKAERQQQLRDIIKHCFELKQRLDRQKHTYHFRHSPRQIPYNAEYMRSSSSPPLSQEIVKCSLWPMLTKLVADETWEVVEREVVRTGPP